MTTKQKSNLAYSALFVAGITFLVTFGKCETKQAKPVLTKIEYKPVKADSVYDDNEQPVFDYWIEIDSADRFK